MKRSVLIVIALFLILKISQLFMNHLAVWDEAVYVAIGKYLFSGGSIGLYEPIRPLLVPFLSGFLWFLGITPVIGTRLLMILFAAGSLVLTYYIARDYFDEKTAFFAVLLLAATQLFFEHSTNILTEIPALFFMLASVYSVMNEKHWLTGIFVGLSVLAKFPNILLIPLILAWVLYYREWKDCVKVGAGMVLICLPFFIFNWFTLGNPLLPFLLASKHSENLAHAVASPLLNLFYYFVIPFVNNPLLVLAFFGIAFAFKQRRQAHVLLFSVIALYLLYFTFITNKQPRFFLLFIAPVILFAAFGLKNALEGRWRTPALFFLVIAGIWMGGQLFFSYMSYDSFEQPRETVYAALEAHAKDGAILTTDPIPAAYIDRQFIPFYYTQSDIQNASEVYEQEYANVNVVLFTPAAFGCEFYHNKACYTMVSGLQSRLDNDFTLMFNQTDQNRPYLLYAKE